MRQEIYIHYVHWRKSHPATGVQRWNKSLCQRRFFFFFFLTSLSIVDLKSMKSECVWRWQCRTWRAISSCSLHHTFGVIPSCPLLQGSECCNKPWMNKVLFFKMYAIKFEWRAARVFPMAICILGGCKNDLWRSKEQGGGLTSQFTNNVRKPFLSSRGRHSRRLTTLALGYFSSAATIWHVYDKIVQTFSFFFFLCLA